jgi:hypothetical protein
LVLTAEEVELVLRRRRERETASERVGSEVVDETQDRGS